MPRWVTVLFVLFLLNLAYVIAFPTATIFYMANVLLHLALGTAAVGAAVMLLRERARWVRVGALLSLVSGGALAYFGNTTDTRTLFWTHVGLSVLAAAVFVALYGRREAWRRPMAVAAAIVALFSVTGFGFRWANPERIQNPTVYVPTSMQEEGGGPKSPFWPSAAKTNVGGTIPSDFFMDSKRCGECHKDIYEQWNSSVHHFASFNNQFYRKSIEHMQEVSGTQGSKWCAGCHDHAVFFNGRFDKPIKDQIDTPEAQNGLGCVSCHSITHIDSTMGNGGFTIEYPPLHELASSKNPYVKKFDNFLTFLQPEPHKRTFLKPFMRLDSAEFCSTCHKVHLDQPVNNYRWLRGFNDYDNWQASGVSGQGARSFYYPAKTSTCAECHMPLVPSRDPGHRNGMVHSHRFPAANMAVAYVNQDEAQMKATEEFLKSGFISVDIFAAAPIEEQKGQAEMRRRSDGPVLMSTMAVGEEAEQQGQVLIREVGKVAAPLDHAGVSFTPGSTVRLDVVVRTRKIGHFFPGGTVDAFDVWLELLGKDADGRVVFWSGYVEDEGKGPVEKGAHMYRSYQLDGEGNPINKRNAWQTRSLLYVRLIPPGAADTVHYRVQIPKDARGPLTFEAKLNYRKFSHYYTQYAYAGQPKPGQDPQRVGLAHDSREYSFDRANIPANVSGKIKGEIPNLPIVTLAKASAKLNVAAGAAEWKPVVRKADRERWNDWGIGMLLQGDLKGAEYAFRRVTEAEPEYADGWLNVARALIQEGENDAAKPFLEKSLAVNRELGRTHFFKAMVQKADGDYDGALASLRTAAAKYPRDRVVLNQIGRILFLQRKYAEAVEAFQRVLGVDPEDLQAHYNLMLCYRGLGDVAKAEREEKLFRRFKADESAQAITAKPRLLSVEDNNERQMIHDHENAWPPPSKLKQVTRK
jgi:tetratricopeptide (TPR) repeat protein